MLSSSAICQSGQNPFEDPVFIRPIPVPLPIEIGVVFSGQVVSSFGRSLEGAIVEVNGKIAQTNENGLFRIVLQPTKEVDPNWHDPNDLYGTRYVLNIHKQGYGLVSKVYDASVLDKIWVLPPASVVTIDPTLDNIIRDTSISGVCTGTLSSRVNWVRYAHRRKPYRVDGQGRYVGPASAEAENAARFAESAGSCAAGASVMIPANSLVDSQGIPARGEATISLSTVNIYDSSSMPGDYTVDLDDRTGYMVTYGAGTVSARSGGKSLQLQKDATATLAIPIHSAQLKRSKPFDPNIPCLRYDESTGMWQIIGEALLDPDNMAYVAEIDHFSAFNMDLVKTDQACVRIDSSQIDEDFQLEVSIPFEGDTIVRTISVDNTPEKIHAIYNLPSHTEIVLRAFRETGGNVIPITDTITVDTGAPQQPQTPNRPEHPYEACNGSVALTEEPQGPILSGPGASSGTFTLTWDYVWPGGIVSTGDGYQLEESTTSSDSGFSAIHSTLNQNDRREHVEHTLTRTTGDYWYRVRARHVISFTPYSNVVYVPVDTTPASTVTRFVNDSSYILVSLIIDGSQYIPAPENSILPGYSVDIDVSAGQHSYEAKNGWWNGGSRFEMYVWSGNYTQPSGATQTISFSDPTINALLTQFGNSGLWSGSYFDSYGIPHSRQYRFFANGTWTRWVDSNYNDSGTYTEVSRDPSAFSITFSTGQHQGTYYELQSYFIMRDGPSFWPLIDYYYQGQ